ncbi:MAG TPA: hypothetical protein GX707_11570, partial [Epulopiscium sp.]|nr:hypothetical protein [Candidatus Epulonipiscium sp.]
LQDITEREAQAEGSEHYEDIDFSIGDTYVAVFKRLWNSTARTGDLSEYDWESNPYVWVIEFERVEVDE